LDDDSFLYHYLLGIAGGGLPSAGMLAYAVATRDEERIKEAVLVEAAVLGTQATMLTVANALQGPKYRMSFHAVHSGMNAMRGLIVSNVARATAAPIAAGAIALGVVTAADETIRYLTDGMAGIMPDVDFMKWTQY